jgi:hypothetical protein
MGERGGLPLALLILVLGVVAVLWLTADACFQDEGESDDLGSIPTLVVR